MNTIKKSLAICTFCMVASFASAQIEIKANPLALLFEIIQVGVEKPIGDDWGIDADLIAGGGALFVTTAGKYYFNPKFGADRFHIGLFTGIGSVPDDNLGIGAGFLAGYKLASKKGILAEIGLGIGRGTGGVIPYYKFHFGYRINRDQGKATMIDEN